MFRTLLSDNRTEIIDLSIALDDVASTGNVPQIVLKLCFGRFIFY